MSFSTRMAGLRAMLFFDNRWQLIFNRFVFKNAVAIYRYKGCKIIVDHDGGDASGVRECIVSDMYRKIIPFMKLQSPLTILDCGANTGGFPLLFHTEGFVLSKVVSVEMNPYAYSRLQYNLFTNLNAKTICLNAVVEDDTGARSICFGLGSTGDSLFSNNRTGRRFEIQSRSLNDLITEHFHDTEIDIVKIDIEGAEYIVFGGSHYNLLSQCRHVVIEIHTLEGRNKQSVISGIQNLGFDLVHQHSDVYLFSRRAK